MKIDSVLTPADSAQRSVRLWTAVEIRISQTDVLVRVAWERTRRAVSVSAIIEHGARAVARGLISADVAVTRAVVAPAIAVVAVIATTTATAVADYVLVVVLHFKARLERMQ